LAQFGIVGIILAFLSFLSFILTLILTIASLTSLRNIHYYITNLRLVREQGVISKKSGELPLDHLAALSVRQDLLNKIRGLGTIYFNPTSGSSVVFQRVKDPEVVKQTALNAKSRLPRAQQIRPAQQPMIREIIRETVLVQCRHCGARSPQGTLRCSDCGANL
jgi:uncharacterized membrane protein YdbT with pleckstrin-like domain/ribosomal protein L40E